MLQHETVVTMAPAGRPSTHGQAPSPWTAWNMQAWLLFSTTMKLDRILGLQFICCFFHLFVVSFLASLLIWGIGEEPGILQDLEDRVCERAQRDLGCNLLQVCHQSLLLSSCSVWVCLMVPSRALRSSHHATCFNLKTGGLTDSLIWLIDWLMESNVATL